MQYSFTESVICCLKDKVESLTVCEDKDNQIDIIELRIETCRLSHNKSEKFYGRIKVNSNDGKILIAIPYSDGEGNFCNRINMCILNEKKRLADLHRQRRLSLKDLSFINKLLKSKIIYEMSDDVIYLQKEIDLSKWIIDLPEDAVFNHIYSEFLNLYKDSKVIVLKLIEKYKDS